jgi:rhomboid protease GluP
MITDPSPVRFFPWLTVAVFVVTSIVTGWMLLQPQIGTALQRDPLMLGGEWWRFVTTWLVLTDGWLQIVINSLGLLIFGTLVERRYGRLWWIAAYVIAGLAGEIAGIFWQPVGGGNSVAICGLIGLFSVGLTQRKALPVPARWGSFGGWGAIGVWLATRADIHGAALLAGFAVGAAALMIRHGEDAA